MNIYSIIVVTKILLEKGLNIDIINMIIMLSYSKRQLPCKKCAPSRCEVCLKCLKCSSGYRSIICEECSKSGWYMCGNHCTICNDEKNKHCLACYR